MARVIDVRRSILPTPDEAMRGGEYRRYPVERCIEGGTVGEIRNASFDARRLE
jgi:hypothetical protein